METIFLRFHLETGMMRMVWRIKRYNSGQNGINTKMVEEKQEEPEPSMWDQLLDKVGEYVDQEIEQLPAEEQEAAVMKLAETADTFVDAIDKAYTVTEKACDSIIDSLDELEKWIDKW